jgi:hypothetical protein
LNTSTNSTESSAESSGTAGIALLRVLLRLERLRLEIRGGEKQGERDPDDITIEQEEHKIIVLRDPGKP